MKDLFRDVARYLWDPPEDFPRELKLEWRLVAIRWASFIFIALGLPLANLNADRQYAIYVLLAVAAVYNGALQRLMPRKPDIFAKGYLTTLGDSLLTISMVFFGGGFESSFYYLLYSVTIAGAMRYGYGPAGAMVVLYVFFDVLEHVVVGVPFSLAFVFRSGFLFFSGILASYLREQAQRAESALQDRLRQASLLNEATAMLGASLEFEKVVAAAAAAASYLFGGACAVLTPPLRRSAGDPLLSPVVHCADPNGVIDHDQLIAACHESLAGEHSTPQTPGEALRLNLPSGATALVFPLALRDREVALPVLGVVAPSGRHVPEINQDIVESFVERVTLSIENAALYRTLASRSTDLQRAYADLAIAHQDLLSVDEMKTNFLANVSHELRTPLTSIRSFSEMLLTYDDQDVQREFLEVINSESERLTRLVNDVLDIAKIESGQMQWNLERFETGNLLEECARAYRPLLEQRELGFEVQRTGDLPELYGDRDRIQQVISNLLNNAMKFTREGTITLGAERTGDEVLISVTDTGIGVAEEDQERIFEKFQQVGAMLTDKPDGTGLGLAICRDFVAHHGGRLWIESELGRGSTFLFTLPISEVAEQIFDQGEPLPLEQAA